MLLAFGKTLIRMFRKTLWEARIAIRPGRTFVETEWLSYFATTFLLLQEGLNIAGKYDRVGSALRASAAEMLP